MLRSKNSYTNNNNQKSRRYSTRHIQPRIDQDQISRRILISTKIKETIQPLTNNKIIKKTPASIKNLFPYKVINQ